ncbi:hypothetical protein Q9634_004402 [Salmonella enterica]|nr:hypothetical protein [Salmonella enterica]ELH0461882.1 hypothetical protein [Salmonella enterica]
MERLKQAAVLANLDIDRIDFPLLVGALAKIACWYKNEPHLEAIGHDSLCSVLRKEGQTIIDALTNAERNS